MSGTCERLSYKQIHVDIARNATDDFNPFHDPLRWRNILDNPFRGPIVLGFQLEGLVESYIDQRREASGEQDLIGAQGLNFSNYDFRFVQAVRPQQAISLVLRDSRFSGGGNASLANRVNLHADGRLALTGYKKETQQPLFPAAIDLSELGDLSHLPDRSLIGESDVFLLRKYMTTSNAKNFLCSSLVEQTRYIDELAERVRFPELFPCSLISCSLLERAWSEGHDFERQPLVYRSHHLSVDRRIAARLRSNDLLHLLCSPLASERRRKTYAVMGVTENAAVLFQGRVDLVALAN